MTTRWQIVTPEAGLYDLLKGPASHGTPHSINRAEKPTYEQLSEAVGGYIESVELSPSYSAVLESLYGLPITATYVNEEAGMMPERYPVNPLATSMLHARYAYRNPGAGVILGCMVIVFSDEEDE